MAAKASLNIKTNIEDIKLIAERLQGDLPETAGDAASIIAHSFIMSSERVMRRNGSVVTGQGIRSLRPRDMGKGKVGVYGNAYLEDLDTGTVRHWPETDNMRFRTAANSYGMSTHELAEVIAQKGTKPHPWIADASKMVRSKAKDKAEIEFNRAMQKSLNRT